MSHQECDTILSEIDVWAIRSVTTILSKIMVCELSEKNLKLIFYCPKIFDKYTYSGVENWKLKFKQ